MRALDICGTPLDMPYIKTEKEGEKERRKKDQQLPRTRDYFQLYIILGKSDKYGVAGEYI